MSRSGRISAAAGVVAFGALAVGCGTTDPASQERLPPIRTTTPTTTTTTTTLPAGQRFYTIKQGDTLAAIADSFQVPVVAIVDLNGLDNPDDIQAGQTIEIPAGVVVVDELPAPPAAAATTGG
jgi:LysM repeat protein